MHERWRRRRRRDAAEICDGLLETFVELDRRLPAKARPRQGDVRLPLLRIVGRQRLETKTTPAAGLRDDFFRQLANGEFVGISEVHRPGKSGLAVHEADQPHDEIIYVAEGARLVTVAEDRDRLTLERLDDEIRDHPPIGDVHTWPVGIEDT